MHEKKVNSHSGSNLNNFVKCFGRIDEFYEPENIRFFVSMIFIYINICFSIGVGISMCCFDVFFIVIVLSLIEWKALSKLNKKF